MSGILSNVTRLSQRADIERFIKLTRIEIHVPSYAECATCGFDAITASGLDPSCGTCNGRGRIAVDQRGTIRGRVSWIDLQKYNMYQGMPTGEIGDCSMQIDLRHRALMDQVERTEGAYLVIDGKTVKPFAVVPNRVEAPTSLDVRCKITHRFATTEGE